jgi:8-oxo-dGTP diphosphatase
MDDRKKRQSLRCLVYPLGTLKEYKYVVVCTRYEGQWLLSRHKKRDTWETQGGHIEQGETPLDAAQRELYEESGVSDAEIIPVCDYYGYDDKGHSNGVVFLAKVHSHGTLPESEMERVQAFAQLPENLTYPSVTPVLMAEALKCEKE